MNHSGLIIGLCCMTALAAASPVQAQTPDAFTAYQHKDYAAAYQGFQQLAAQGNLNAMNDLGMMYMNGQGVKQDYAAAGDWFKKAAEKGHTHAITNLGTLYEMGQGVTQSYDQAAQLYRIAANYGISAAQYNLAALYEAGHGVPKDPMQAYIWYGLAAQGGSKKAETEKERLRATLDPKLLGPADAYIKSWKPRQS